MKTEGWKNGEQKVPHVEGDAWSGITKREYFAAKAMQAYASGEYTAQSGMPHENIAEWSVKMADALLEALANEPPIENALKPIEAYQNNKTHFEWYQNEHKKVIDLKNKVEELKQEVDRLKDLQNKIYSIADAHEFSPEKIRQIKTKIEIHRALTSTDKT